MNARMMILLPLLAGGIHCGLCQSSEGIITYEVRTDLHRNVPPDRAEMKNVMPPFSVTHARMFFNAHESLYKPIAEEPDTDSDNGKGMRMRIRVPRYEVYVKAGGSKRVMLQEFMGKKYLIEDSIAIHPWKIGTTLRDINGYPCREASFYDEERKATIVAWYTDKLRTFLGPEKFHTLPGAVLLVDINDGERIIKAVNIEFRDVREEEIIVPSAKVRLTEAEYRKLVREQTERMRANGGNMIIRN